MKKIELLAPVGSEEALSAAVWNGADAVYLAGKSFGARKYAANFDDEALQRAVSFCHKHGVSVYVTVNTLIADAEMHQLVEYIDFLYTADVDALIVQDLGVLELVRNRYPDFELHASTQMTAHSAADIQYLQEKGVQRIVLPREMNSNEIAALRSKTDMDFECFVHGALCISYSGQCLMSSMIGGRSGNRGSCAQSCRQPYTLVDMETGLTQEHAGGKYLLSPKDLSALENVPALIEAGVYSFKIEGRMKRPEYAATVVAAYRHAIDSALNGSAFDLDKWQKDTASIFTRGFTKGHLFGDLQNDRMNQTWPGNTGVEIGVVEHFDKNRNRMQIRISDTLNVGDEIQIRRGSASVGARVEFIEIGRSRVKSAEAEQSIIMNMQYPVKAGEIIYRTVNEALLKDARASYARPVQRVSVEMDLLIKEGLPARLTLKDSEGHSVVVEGDMPEKAMKVALDRARIEGQVSKLGDTAYKLEKLRILLDDGLSLPMKSFNGLRRDAVEALDALREKRYTNRQVSTDQAMLSHTKAQISTENDSEDKVHIFPKFNVEVRTIEQLDAAIEEGDCNILVSTLEMLSSALERRSEIEAENEINTFELIFAPGRIVRDYEFAKFDRELDLISQADGIWAGTYGMIKWAHEKGLHVIGADQGLNVFNRVSASTHCEAGLIATLSPEMTLGQIKAMQMPECALEAMVYGRQTVMITEYCPISAALSNGKAGCGLCEQTQYGLQDKMGAIFPILRANVSCRTKILNSKILFVPEELENLYDAGVHNFRMVFTLETGENVKDALRYYKHTLDYELTQEDDAVKNRFVSMGLTRGHYHRGVLTEE